VTYSKLYLDEVSKIAQTLDIEKIENLAVLLSDTRARKGRLFICGVGGSAGNASHAVNDFRKIVEIEAFCPSDNVSELTARANDEGFDKIYSRWLELAKVCQNDTLLILSVGGGNEEKNVSVCLINAIKIAKSAGASVVSICGKKDGYAQQNSDIALIVGEVSNERITPHSEEFQGVIWHLLVSHPILKQNQTTWESMDKDAASNISR